MPSLEINPRYADLLERHRLQSADQFLSLPGVIVGGHPNRNVARVALGNGAGAVGAFLKREHRVSWRARLVNAWAGFGLISHSRREARLLRHLRRAGVGCPDWIAAGEDDRGRAFLLVRELAGTAELRQVLRSPLVTPGTRRRLARRLGEALTHMHEAGFDHPNLYAKHILVGPDHQTFHFLDWQRSHWRPFLSWPRRWRDLATLHATLADELAGPRDRLALLHAYLQASLPGRMPRFLRAGALRRILRHAVRLGRHRHVRELRRPTSCSQQLVWLDGEALCVTPEVKPILADHRPNWLRAPSGNKEISRTVVTLPEIGPATLVQRRMNWSWSGLWSWLRGRPPETPELRQAALLFRLQRYGVRAPRLLGFGRRQLSPVRGESFLLAESLDDTVSLECRQAQLSFDPSGLAESRRLIRETAAVLGRTHEASCFLQGRSALPFRIQDCEVVIHDVGNIRVRRHAGSARRFADVTRFRAAFPAATRTDALRFLIAYLDQPGLTHEVRKWWKRFARSRGKAA